MAAKTPTGAPEVEATDENTVDLEEIEDRVARYLKAKEVEKAGKDAAEETRHEIASYLEARGAEFGMLGGELVIRWRPVTSRRLNQKKLGAAHPDLVEEFTTESTSMRMEIVQ